MSSKCLNKKILCKCNNCLNKNKEGCWLLKETYDKHIKRQKHFQQINTQINELLNLLLSISDNEYENNKYILI
jgi:hypothetical protein